MQGAATRPRQHDPARIAFNGPWAAPGDRPAGSTQRRLCAVLEKLGLRLEAHLVENEWVNDEWQSGLGYAILDREWRAQSSTAR